MTLVLPSRAGQRGASIVELMIAIAIGLMILAVLAQVFADSSQTHREMQRTAEQIENGRYAADVLAHDLHHAGYYGQYFRIPDPGTVLPDPCAVSDAGLALTSGLPFPVQAYDAPDATSRPDVSATSCGAALGNANVLAGTDILVVRRASTAIVPAGSSTVANEVYVQVNPVEAAVQLGNGGVLGLDKTADGSAAVIRNRDGTAGGEVRKLEVRVYFVAPCSRPAGGGDVCTGVNDDGGRPMPTLKRLELTSVSGSTAMRIVPIAEGIQSLQVDYGIDDSPSAANPMTGLRGDGSPDRYVRAPSIAEAPNVAAARVHVLARGSEPSTVVDGAKTYRMGLSGTLGPFADGFKRHVYVSVVRLVNTGGRREIPQ